MSFSDNVKLEIANKELKNDCCKIAFVYGFMLASNALFGENIKLNIKIEEISKLCRDFFQDIFRDAIEHENTNIIKIENTKYIELLHDKFHLNKKKNYKKINPKNIKNNCCKCSFLKGVFIACAYVNNPKKYYRLEFKAFDKIFGNELLKMINEIDELDINAKLSTRREKYIVYIKNNNQICDILAYLGARNSAMMFIENSMIKDVRNYVNRTNNFETANISKTATAAAKQIRAIKIIKEKNGLSSLSNELRELAEIRLQNPQMSLKELNLKLKKPLSKSGLNHRFNKLIEISKN